MSLKNPVANSARTASWIRRVIHAVADVHRQVVVDRALGDALQALDADVADGEVDWRLRAERAPAAAQASRIAAMPRTRTPRP